jgi:hypothetical protein
MKRPETRHYTEEELLMHALREEAPETGEAVSAHLDSCGECHGVYLEYEALVGEIHTWPLPELPEDSWEARKAELMSMFRRELEKGRRRGFSRKFEWRFQRIWEYALDNPLPAMGYVAAAVAFASERTITVFRLDRILPATSEVINILRQVL